MKKILIKLRGALLLASSLHLSATALAQTEDQQSKSVLEPDAANLRTFIELARTDIKAQKALVLAQNMEFTNDEAVEFWPLYREYDLELSKLHDERLSLIREYINFAESLSEKQARDLAADSLLLEEKRTALKRKYFKKFAKIITARKSIRFFQIENQINSAIDLRIAAALPLIK